ncbi:hypothetical protein G6F35_016482 [Rhizopus arrhizus]|nr:hypothetical protein G6F35_016482 [Rhizopus arrhizus]
MDLVFGPDKGIQWIHCRDKLQGSIQPLAHQLRFASGEHLILWLNASVLQRLKRAAMPHCRQLIKGYGFSVDRERGTTLRSPYADAEGRCLAEPVARQMKHGRSFAPQAPNAGLGVCIVRSSIDENSHATDRLVGPRNFRPSNRFAACGPSAST